MTSSDSILSLISRLEQATAPSMELDSAITRLIGYSAIREKFSAGTWWLGPGPAFTGSESIALKLIPDGFTWAAGNCGENNLPWCCITADEEPCADYTGDGFNVAISIVIASLKALSHTP